MLGGLDAGKDRDGANSDTPSDRNDPTNPLDQDKTDPGEADARSDAPEESTPDVSEKETIDSSADANPDVDPSEDTDPDTNSGVPPELMEALPAAFRDAIEKASREGTGVLIVSNGNFPQELLDPDHANDMIDARREVKRHIETFEDEREHVKEYILPRIDHEIAKLSRRREAIADQYDLNSPGKGADFSKMGPDERQDLKDRVLQAERNLPQIVRGQDQAITPVITALKRAVTGTRDLNRPIMSVLEVGRTGVGKTLLAKSLARELSSDTGLTFDFLKIDCSEYSSGHEGARLTGAPPGYIGFETGGQFQAIQENPFQVVLFDEIEKGSQQLHNMLLQILEDGEATLGNGEKVNFRNCIIIMTSNVGVGDLDKALNPIGYQTRERKGLTDKEVLEHTSAALKRAFAPEFLNRLDGVIPFNDLSREVAREIAELEIKKVIDRIETANEGCSVAAARSLTEAVLDKGFSPEFGAREIRRAVQSMVEEPLAIEMFKHDFVTLATSDFSIAWVDGKALVRRKDKQVPLPSLDNEPFDPGRMRFVG